MITRTPIFADVPEYTVVAFAGRLLPEELESWGRKCGRSEIQQLPAHITLLPSIFSSQAPQALWQAISPVIRDRVGHDRFGLRDAEEYFNRTYNGWSIGARIDTNRGRLDEIHCELKAALGSLVDHTLRDEYVPHLTFRLAGDRTGVPLGYPGGSVVFLSGTVWLLAHGGPYLHYTPVSGVGMIPNAGRPSDSSSFRLTSEDGLTDGRRE